MKFAIVVFAALIACAAAQPQLGLVGDLLGGVTQGVANGVNGAVGAVGNTLIGLKDLAGQLLGPDGLLGKIVNSGVFKVVGNIVNSIAKELGIPGLGCIIGNVLDQGAVIVNQLDKIVTGLVCNAGAIAADTLKPILAQIENREFTITIQIWISFFVSDSV